MFIQICLYFAIIAGVSFLIWYTVGSAHCHDIIEYLEAPQEETTEDMLFYDYYSGLIFKANPEVLRSCLLDTNSKHAFNLDELIKNLEET